MFSVVYEFDVIADKENDFKLLWRQLTIEIKTHRGGLGSRLHKVVASQNKWIAYAEWPSRTLWLDRTKSNPVIDQLSNQLKATCHSIQTIYELEVIDDLLVFGSNDKPHPLS